MKAISFTIPKIINFEFGQQYDESGTGTNLDFMSEIKKDAKIWISTFTIGIKMLMTKPIECYIGVNYTPNSTKTICFIIS